MLLGIGLLFLRRRRLSFVKDDAVSLTPANDLFRWLVGPANISAADDLFERFDDELSLDNLL